MNGIEVIEGLILQIPGFMIDVLTLIGVGIFIIFLCGYCNKGGRTKTYVYRKTPTADKVEGFGGSRHIDHSYYGPYTGWSSKGPLPIGFSTTPQREKPETYRIHKERHDESRRKETK